MADAARAVEGWSRSSPSAIVAMDDEGHIVAMNAPAEALLGRFSPRPWVGRETQLVEATLPDGRRAVLLANAGPLLDEAGTFVGMIFAADDRSDAAAATRVAEGHAGKERRVPRRRADRECRAGAAVTGP